VPTGDEAAGVKLETEGVPAGDDPDDEGAGDSLGAGELTGRTPLGLGTPGTDEDPAAGVVSVTGQIVVEIAIVEVTTAVEPAGQSVTLAAQLVMVISLVV
jgi:hypothetical protein